MILNQNEAAQEQLSNFLFQLQFWGYALTDNSPVNRVNPAEVCERRDKPDTTYIGHPMWDRTARWLRSIEIHGIPHCKELFALPYAHMDHHL